MALQRSPTELTRSERGAAIVARHEADNRRDRIAAMALHAKALRGSRSAIAAVRPGITASVGRGSSTVPKAHAPSPAKPTATAPVNVAPSSSPVRSEEEPTVTADSLVTLARSVRLSGFTQQPS
jgi:hypothetical protein